MWHVIWLICAFTTQSAIMFVFFVFTENQEA
jgi:hypothetical protein